MTTVVMTRFGIRPEWRELFYRYASGSVALLLAFGYLEEQEAALWTQLGISTVTLLFASLFAPGTWRQFLYPVLALGGAVATWYGIVNGEDLPLILSAAAQMFGITTAGAKVVQTATLHVQPASSPPTLSP